MSRRVLSLLALSVTLAACGSTVQVSSTVASGSSQASDGGFTTGPTGSTADTGTSGVVSGTTGGGTSGSTTGIAGTGTSGGSTSTTGGSGSATGASVPVPTGSIAAKGPGWDAKSVYIGVITQKDTQAIYASFGANNVDPGDNGAQATAMANELNKRGGILGRKIVLRFYDLKTLDTAQNPSVAGQAVCTHYSQDVRVIAVWNSNTQVDQDPTLRTCLAARKVPLFTTAARAIDDQLMKQLSPFYFHTLMVSWDPLATALAQRLKAQGWMSGWNTTLGAAGNAPVKIGILSDSTPTSMRLAKRLTAELAKVGYPGALSFHYSQASDGQSASVRFFSGNKVTHVIVTDVELTAFQVSAASQHYKPRFGITSYNDPWGNLEASGVTPAGANNGAMGVGWAPNLDVSDANDPHTEPGAATCKAVMARGGQSFAGKRLAAAWGFSLCDTLNLIAMGATKGNGFGAANLKAGIAQFRATFPLANGFRPGLWPDGPYVQGAVRDLQWHSDCSCMKYNPTLTPLG